MSVIVKGMKMPENCIKCPLQFGGWCYASPPEIDERVAPTVDEAWEQGKPDWCPLVALPDHHGRLVDADAFKADYGMKDDCADCEKEMRGKVKACMYNIHSKMDFCGWLDDADTIVEAEDNNG